MVALGWRIIATVILGFFAIAMIRMFLSIVEDLRKLWMWKKNIEDIAFPIMYVALMVMLILVLTIAFWVF